jgi:hypothetical protein
MESNLMNDMFGIRAKRNPFRVYLVFDFDPRVVALRAPTLG